MKTTEYISRRSFFKKAAGAIAFPYVIASSALGKSGNIAASERITVGCIGMGWQGTENLRNFLSHSEAQVVAVCDIDIEHLNEARDIVNKHYGNKDCAVYKDFCELLGREDIDAVSIALPDHWHAIPVIMAARLGKNIYGEKPLAYNISEGRAMCEAVKRHGIVWQTGSWQRSREDFRKASELVRNGRIGKVHTIKVGLFQGYFDFEKNGDRKAVEVVPKGFDYDRWLGPAPWAPYAPARCHKNFRWISDYAGGQITDWAGHHCDIAQWGMGTEHTGPVEVEGHGVFPRDGLWDTATDYHFECKYAEGFTMIVSSEFPNGTRWEGSDGWVFVNRGWFETSPASLKDSVIGSNEIHLYRSDDHVGNFLDCVRSRALTITPIEVAQRSISIGHLGIIAMRLGRKVRWDPAKELFIDDAEASRMLSRAMRSPWHL